MKKISIYPFTDSSLPLIEYLPIFLPDCEIVAVVSPLGLGLDGFDAAISANRTPIGITVQSDIQNAIDMSDIILVPHGSSEDPVFQKVTEVIERTLRAGKDVWCGMSLTTKQLKELKSLCKNSTSKFCYGLDESFDWKHDTFYGEYTPSVPVVLVHNLTAEADSFEVTLSLAERFQKDGYQISVIGGRPEYNFFGMHGASLFLNSFYGDEKLSEIPLLLRLYVQYFRHIEAKEHPDVILVNYPGAAMGVKGVYQNESGVLTYLLTQAIRPDYAVVCMLYHEATVSEIRILDKELESRFNIGMDCIHTSNKVLHAEQSKQRNSLQTFYLPMERALEQSSKLRKEFPAFCALQASQKDEMYRWILDSLERGCV